MTSEQIINKEIAAEILGQLGGRRFLGMTGSKNLTSGERSLSMKLIPNKSHAKYLKVRLNGLDLYDMIFFSVGRHDLEPIVKHEANNLYADMIVMEFEKITGLYTQL